MLPSEAVWFGVAVNLATGLTFVVATLRGRTNPNRVSWFLWALAPLVAFAAELRDGVGVAAAMTFVTGFNPALIFLASFVNRRSYWRITRLDVGCGALSLVAFVVWQLTASGTTAIVLAVAADGLAAVPTLVKAYLHPETERPGVFLGGATSAAVTLLTLDRWTVADYAFPAYILLACLLLAGTIVASSRLRDHPRPGVSSPPGGSSPARPVPGRVAPR